MVLPISRRCAGGDGEAAFVRSRRFPRIDTAGRGGDTYRLTSASAFRICCMDRPTKIVAQLNRGQGHPTEEMIQAVYQELRGLAQRYLANDRAGRDMQPTSLIHEAYLRLVDAGRDDWPNANYFFGAAAEAMRRILIEHARKQQRLKHGGGRIILSLDEAAVAFKLPVERFLALDEALAALEQRYPERAELVKLRYFGGLSLQDAAKMIGVSRATADRYWRFARARLYKALEGHEPPAS